MTKETRLTWYRRQPRGMASRGRGEECTDASQKAWSTEAETRNGTDASQRAWHFLANS